MKEMLTFVGWKSSFGRTMRIRGSGNLAGLSEASVGAVRSRIRHHLKQNNIAFAVDGGIIVVPTIGVACMVVVGRSSIEGNQQKQ